jgi:hypothetical protein
MRIVGLVVEEMESDTSRVPWGLGSRKHSNLPPTVDVAKE